LIQKKYQTKKKNQIHKPSSSTIQLLKE